MASENTIGYLTFQAAADLSAAQYFLVKITAADTVNLAGDGELCVGVLQNKPSAAGDAATISRGGDVTKVSAGAAFAVGVKLAADANGQAVLATTGEEVIGISKEAATAQNEIVEMVQTHGGIAA